MSNIIKAVTNHIAPTVSQSTSVSYSPQYTSNISSQPLKSLDELDSSRLVFLKLSKIDWDFTDDKTRYLTHDIHPYPAKFIPQIPRHLILLLSKPGETIWDPFGGSGTTALEAILQNRQAISTDSNPLATIIAEAKTTTLIREEELELEDWIEKLNLLSANNDIYKKIVLDTHADRLNSVPEITNIKDWFNDMVIKELTYVRTSIKDLRSNNVKTIAHVAFSRVVLKVSNQDGETRYAKRDKHIKDRDTLKLFTKELRFCLDKAKALGPLINFRNAKFLTCDLRQQITGISLDQKKDVLIPKNSIDLIVTSPPYPNANDYHLYHRFRLFWLGFDPRKLASIEIGSHLRHQKENTGFDNYLSEMRSCLHNFKSALRPGRFAVMVLGDGVFKGKTYATTKHIAKIATELQMEVVGIIDRAIHQTKRSFISSARRAKTEQLLILRKPKTSIMFQLHPTNYKLWPYEDILRKLEIEATLQAPLHLNHGKDLFIKSTSLRIDKIRRLTFTHGFSSCNMPYEQTWQSLLENTNNLKKTTKKSSNYVTHGIHSYKGKFYPQLAKVLINLANLEIGSKILDPFCGSGTLLLEAYLNGLEGFGFDSNPLAIKIARAKTEILNVEPYTRDKLISQVLSCLTTGHQSDYRDWLKIYSSESQDEILRWFPRKVLDQISLIFHEIRNVPHPAVQEFLEVILSSIIRQVSQQDPRDLRIRKRKQLIEDAPTIELFIDALKAQREKLLSFDNIRNYSPSLAGKTAAWQGDSRDIQAFIQQGINYNTIDAVITSPPYATALPYIDTDRLSILLLFGMSSRDRKPIEVNLTGTREINNQEKKYYDDLIENHDFENIHSENAQKLISRIYTLNKNSDVGFRRKNQASLLFKYFSDMTNCIKNMDKLVKKNGHIFLILGDNVTQAGNNWMPIETVKITKEMGVILGWELVNDIKISVSRENYKHAKNTITENSILWFKKLS